MMDWDTGTIIKRFTGGLRRLMFRNGLFMIISSYMLRVGIRLIHHININKNRNLKIKMKTLLNKINYLKLL